ETTCDRGRRRGGRRRRAAERLRARPGAGDPAATCVGTVTDPADRGTRPGGRPAAQLGRRHTGPARQPAHRRRPGAGRRRLSEASGRGRSEVPMNRAIFTAFAAAALLAVAAPAAAAPSVDAHPSATSSPAADGPTTGGPTTGGPTTGLAIGLDGLKQAVSDRIDARLTTLATLSTVISGAQH